MSDRHVRSNEELKKMMDATDWFTEKVKQEVKEAFVESVLFEGEGVAHMKYGELMAALSEDEFSEVLFWLDISPITFSRNKDQFCYSPGFGARYCSPAETHYCDPALCVSS
jgi:hypothetical protein